MPLLKSPQATITIGDKSVSRLLEGLGVNWCDAFGMGGEKGMGQLNMQLNTNCIPSLDDERHWMTLLEELTLLKAGCVRFQLPPDGFITKRGTMDFDCVHFERLERLNAWAGANGATIILDTMYVPHHLQLKGHDDPEGWAVENRAAANPRQFAENFAGPLLDYCLSERNWTQIRYYSPVNEPLYGGIYGVPGGEPYRAYAAMMASLRQELVDRDLAPQRISLLGPSSPSVQDWPIPDLHSRGLDLDPLLDAYDQHEYFGRFDGDPPNANSATITMSELIHRHLKPHIAYARSKNKPFLITEFGHVYYGSSRGDSNGPSTHDAFLLDAEFAVRAINAGVGAMLRWSFLNPGDIDGRWQFLETADGSYDRVVNTFYGYATLVRYARPHSEVLDIHTESSLYPWPHVYATALRKMPQGDITLLVVNDHPSEQIELTVKLPPGLKPKKINIIRTDRTLKHHKAGEIKRDGKTSQFTDKMPPRSLNVYTSLEHDPLERR
jgi:hypothetical protein